LAHRRRYAPWPVSGIWTGTRSAVRCASSVCQDAANIAPNWADGCGEEAGVLAGGQVTAGEGQDLGLGHALAGGFDLPVLVGVLVAVADIEGDRAVQADRDRGEIPALGVPAVLGDEACGVVGRTPLRPGG
jgi:hypothetical protein